MGAPMRELASPDDTGGTQGKAYRRPAPHHPGIDLELARSVQRSMIELECLLVRYRLAVADINTMFAWTKAIAVWREGLWDILGSLLAAGFDPPDYMLDFDADPRAFIVTWRDFYAKVWPFIDPDQIASRYQPLVTEH